MRFTAEDNLTHICRCNVCVSVRSLWVANGWADWDQTWHTVRIHLDPPILLQQRRGECRRHE